MTELIPLNSTPPVLIIGYTRVNQLVRCIRGVSLFRPPRLYFAFDGPKGKSDEARTCSARIAAVQQVDWECEISTYFSDVNLGCKYFPISAIDWFFRSEPHGIILEDDIILHSSFIDFVSLVRSSISNGMQCPVGIISACSYPTLISRKSRQSPGTIYPILSKIPNIWGWYSSKSVWDEFRIFDSQKQFSFLRTFFLLARNISFKQALLFSLCVRLSRLGSLDAWDYLFAEFLISNGYYAAIPSIGLSENIGFDNDGTHTTVGLSPTTSASSREAFLISDMWTFDRHYDSQMALNTPWQNCYTIHALKGIAKIVYDKVRLP